MLEDGQDRDPGFFFDGGQFIHFRQGQGRRFFDQGNDTRAEAFNGEGHV